MQDDVTRPTRSASTDHATPPTPQDANPAQERLLDMTVSMRTGSIDGDPEARERVRQAILASEDRVLRNVLALVARRRADLDERRTG